MEFNKNIKKIYRILIEIVLGTLLFMCSGYIGNNLYHLISIIFSFSLIWLALIDVALFYIFEARKNFEVNKTRYLFTGAFIILAILSFILYLLIGLVTGFYIAVFGGLVSYIISLCVVMVNKKKKPKK